MVVTIDTLRADHLHCYGYNAIETPNLDGIAGRGVLFENAVAQAPLTPTSHASIFTGQYPTVHGVRSTSGFVLQSSSHPLARILHDQGWETAAFVSSAVLRKVTGFGNGFDVYDDQMPGTAPERAAGATVDRALAWLNTRSAKPYFLWVHLYDPHAPYTPPPAFRAKYRNRPYDGEIAYTDQQLGRLLSALGKDCITAVIADHGESLSEHGEFTHGVFLYDATLHVPFMIAGPGVPAAVRVKQQARSIDLLPTILALLGGSAPADIQGLSLVPTFSGKTVPTDISYEESLYPKISMGWAELRAIRTNRWKYIRAPRPELYDLTQDPRESANVIAQHPQEVDKFEAQLRSVIGSAGSEKVQTGSVDQRTTAQLRSLGYLAGSSPREYELNGQGVDPRDRVEILKLLWLAGESDSHVPPARRLALLKQAVNEDPGNTSLYEMLGGTLEQEGQLPNALDVYQAAEAKGVADAYIHSRIANMAALAGNIDAAIAEYETAAQLNPTDLENQTNLATAYMHKGRFGDAERVLQFVISSDPAFAPAQSGLGVVALQKHDMPAAQAHFEKAVQSNPDLLDAQMNLGVIYAEAGNRARARACFEAFLAKASPQQYGPIIPKVKQELAALQ